MTNEDAKKQRSRRKIKRTKRRKTDDIEQTKKMFKTL